MQRIAGGDVLLGIKVIPALAAFVLRPGIPGNRQGLQSSVRKFDQVLLQRLDAEHIADLEIGQFAVRAVGGDVVSIIAPEECRPHPVILEAGVVEISEHGFVSGMLHGLGVLGSTPILGLGGMAAGTGFRTDEFRLGSLHVACRHRSGSSRVRASYPVIDRACQRRNRGHGQNDSQRFSGGTGSCRSGYGFGRGML